MRRSFTIPIKPFSVNAMYYGQRSIKTQECRDWEHKVIWQLSKPAVQQVLKELREAYKPGDTFKVRLVAYYPETEYYNKQGLISAKVMDLSNWEKPILDLIFLPKIHSQSLPYGCPNINQDDRFVRPLVSDKLPHKENSHLLKITIWLNKKVDNPSS